MQYGNEKGLDKEEIGVEVVLAELVLGELIRY